MERLKDRRFAPGSPEATASELLRELPARAVSVQLKRRVRERVLLGRPKVWAPLWLRPALAIAAVVVAGSAAAAIGHAWLTRARVSTPSEAKPTVARVISPASPPTSSDGSPAPIAATEPQPVPQPAPLPPAETRAAPARSAEDAAPSEASLVYGAAKALHSGSDPARAAQLLDEYSRRYPHGALAEEALALTIDLSLARGDGRAPRLAQRYLARYPSGHFRAKAERVLAAP